MRTKCTKCGPIKVSVALGCHANVYNMIIIYDPLQWVWFPQTPP